MCETNYMGSIGKWLRDQKVPLMQVYFVNFIDIKGFDISLLMSDLYTIHSNSNKFHTDFSYQVYELVAATVHRYSLPVIQQTNTK